MTEATQVGRVGREVQLALELAGLYVLLPVVLALMLPPAWLFPVLFAVTLLALALLGLTPGFAWRALGRGWRGLDWGRRRGIVAFAGACRRIGL